MNNVIDTDRVYQEAQQGEFEYFSTFLRRENEPIFHYENNERKEMSYYLPKCWYHIDKPSTHLSLFHYIVKHNRTDLLGMMLNVGGIIRCIHLPQLYVFWHLLKEAFYLKNNHIEKRAWEHILSGLYVKKIPEYFVTTPELFIYILQLIERVHQECPRCSPTSARCILCKNSIETLENEIIKQVLCCKNMSSDWMKYPETIRFFKERCIPFADDQKLILSQCLNMYINEQRNARNTIITLVLDTLPKDVINFVIVPYLYE
jgi:hypothetical protein